MGRLQWNFDIDRYLNYVVAPAPWKHLPYPLARFFGYRRDKPAAMGNLVPIFWAFVGIWCSISIIEQVSLNIPSFQHRGAPIIVGSFGAAAVLEFYSIDSPLAQPRNAIFGQLLASVFGVAVAKLFQLSDNFESIRWAGGAVSCAAATAIMALTKTVHPPAGATALLAVVDPDIVHLGWFLIPVMLMGAVLMQAVALLINNIERRFPVYFWTPEDLTGKSIFARKTKKVEDDATDETEIAKDDEESDKKKEAGVDVDVEAQGAKASGGPTNATLQIVIGADELLIPENVVLSAEEKQILEDIRKRL